MTFTKLALTGTTGKLGGATLNALLQHKLIDPASLVLSTSSDPNSSRWDDLKKQGVEVRRGNFDDPASLEAAFAGCDRLFMVSSSDISLDFHSQAKGGREKHHIATIEAARRAGVKHIYYTSLAFGDDSKAGVMRAHYATERYLQDHVKDADWTVLREGLYNESWPLYFGHWDVGSDERTEVRVGGDGPISWTSIPDLGLANASILVDDTQSWKGKTVTLSARKASTLKDIAAMVSKRKGYEAKLQVVSANVADDFYIQERGLDGGMVKWWSSTYGGLANGELEMNDETLERLLGAYGRKPKPMEETVLEMESGGS